MKALITGANSLVNKALLAKLVAMGYEVTAHYHADNDITEELKKEFSEVTFIQADFSDKESFLQFQQQASGKGKFDVIVNAVVYYAESKTWEEQRNWDAWQKSFAVNTTAAGVLMANAGPNMNKGGVIVNISSTVGQPYMGDMQYTIYSACKAALNSLTVTYAKRWAPDIRVAGIAPGMIKSAWNKDMTKQDKAKVIKPQLTHEWVLPEEIADLMEAIVKNKSINATTVVIDGGMDAPIV